MSRKERTPQKVYDTPHYAGLDLDDLLGPACPECGYRVGHWAGISDLPVPEKNRPRCSRLGSSACRVTVAAYGEPYLMHWRCLDHPEASGAEEGWRAYYRAIAGHCGGPDG